MVYFRRTFNGMFCHGSYNFKMQLQGESHEILTRTCPGHMSPQNQNLNKEN